MVAEPWILKMGNQVSSNLKHALYIENSTKVRKQGIIGILSFEVGNVMSKIIHLYQSLTDHEVLKLKNEILSSEGIKNLVSSDENHLLELTLVEKLDDLNRIACIVSRLGKRCTISALQGFEHVFADIISGVIDVKELKFLVKDMESMVRKMERYVNSTANLYSEMEALNELELSAKKFQRNQHEESRKAFEQKLTWQKQDVSHLMDISLWNQTYDKIVELLARTVCTIYARIHIVFGQSHQREDNLSVSRKSNEYCHSGPIVKEGQKSRAFLGSEDFNFPCGVGPGRLFLECLSLSSSASRINDDDQISQISACFSVGSVVKREIPRLCKGSLVNSTKFGSKTNKAYAPPTTIGGSALALHYANIIIVIEKLLQYPHLVGEEARGDLYQMLPTSLRKTLKTRLKSYTKDLAIYDAPLAHDWRERLEEMLKWIAPLAHNMMRWQNDRNFEQRQMVSNVLLFQTLYFADREKTEGAICELLVGLNYMCRYEQQQSALLDCASSFDFEECVEWQAQANASFRS